MSEWVEWLSLESETFFLLFELSSKVEHKTQPFLCLSAEKRFALLLSFYCLRITHQNPIRNVIKRVHMNDKNEEKTFDEKAFQRQWKINEKLDLWFEKLFLYLQCLVFISSDKVFIRVHRFEMIERRQIAQIFIPGTFHVS